MKRPTIICHMTTSIDGKVTGNFLETEAGMKACDVYYEINRDFKADAFVCGRVTMESSFTQGWYPNLSEYTPIDSKEDYVAKTDTSYFAVAMDRKGRLGWKESKIFDEDPGYNNCHIIEVLETANLRYLSYLQKTGISYIFASSIQEAVEKLYSLFGIKTLLLEGGSIINGAFLKEDLVDELSLVVAPILENKGKPLFDQGNIEEYELKNVKTYKDSIIWLQYRKKD